MGVAAVVHEVVKILSEVLGVHLALMAWDNNNLVLRKLYGTSLMNIDMSRIHGNHALILVEHRVNHRGIGLRTASQKENVRVIILAGFFYEVLCPHATLVSTIGLSAQVVGLNQFLQHLWMCAITVVVIK